VFIALMSGLACAQANTSTSNTTSDPSNLGDEIKQLRELMVQQRDLLITQQQQLADQKKQLTDQQQELQKLREQVNGQSQTAANSTDSTSASSASDASVSEPRLVNASLTAPNLSTKTAGQPVSTAAATQETERRESPLSFRIGGAEFTPGGFMDFTSIFRTTNEGTLGTNFYNIPLSNAETGHLTETRFTAQNSRLSLKATSKFGDTDVAGYVEMDFLGNDGNGIEITSNSHTLRERLYFVDLKRHKWEVAAGQMWSWLTPNRVGVSPYTSDVFYSLDMDFNYQAGLTWARQPGVHLAYHPNDNWAIGVGIENPEQFGGQANEVTFPSAFNATLTGGTNTQIDQNNITTGTPNVMPDILPKITYDTTVGGKHFHVEGVGLLSGFKVTDLPTVTGATFVEHTKLGGGGSVALNLELFKNFHLVSNAFWSDGGGRYIFGMAPDLVVLPVNAPGATCAVTGTTTKTAAGCDAAISLVHAGSGIAGFEYQVTPHTMLYSYYGGMYAQRNFALDITATTATQPDVGFGFPGSNAAANRSIQEPSAGWIQTFWRNPQYGALQLITQGSYLTRSPWFVAAGTPKNAHLFMGWADLRYVLP
jgi:DNA-binding protein H-NS